MRSLREVLRDAEQRRVAVGHFNFSELVVLKAAAEAASELGVPVVMGVSESEREFVDRVRRIGEAAGGEYRRNTPCG